MDAAAAVLPDDPRSIEDAVRRMYRGTDDGKSTDGWTVLPFAHRCLKTAAMSLWKYGEARCTINDTRRSEC